MRFLNLALICVVILCAGVSTRAHANALTIDYFTISPSDPDINHLCCGNYSNQVTSTLGPNGLPVLNSPGFGTSPYYSGPTIQDVNPGTNELTWWSPAFNSHVTATGSATVTLPFNVPYNFFPPNGTGPNDNNGYQAAILSGTLIAPSTQTISFGIGADDSAFAYLDRKSTRLNSSHSQQSRMPSSA